MHVQYRCSIYFCFNEVAILDKVENYTCAVYFQPEAMLQAVSL